MYDASTTLEVPGPVLESVYREARRTFPAECCGWLAGAKDGSLASIVHACFNDQAAGNHPIKAERGAETAYVFNTEDVLALNQSVDGKEPAMIIFHSHPNGQAYLSETDREVATSPWGGPAYPVQQLVVGIDRERVVEAALFGWSDADDGFVEIARYPGAEI